MTRILGTLENLIRRCLDIRKFIGTLDNSEAEGLWTLEHLIGLLGLLILGPFSDIRKFIGTHDNSEGLFGTPENLTGLFVTLDFQI